MKSNNRRAAGFYVQLLAAIAGIVSLIVYFIYALRLGKSDPLVIAGLIISILTCVLQLKIDFTLPVLVGAVVYSLTGFYFLSGTESIGTYTDYFSNIIAFGHPELVNIMTCAAALMIVSALLAVAGSFMRTKRPA